MITSNNLSEVLDLLTEQEINDTLDSNDDYVLLTVSGYGHVSLTSSNRNEDDQEHADSTGGVLCDKDDFLRLFQESDSINPFLIERI